MTATARAASVSQWPAWPGKYGDGSAYADKDLVRHTAILATADRRCFYCARWMPRGTMHARLDWGTGEKEWDRAHDACCDVEMSRGRLTDGRAEREIFTISDTSSSLPKIEWQELDIYEGRNRYAVMEDGEELTRLSVKDEAIGAKKGIEAYLKHHR